MSSNNAYGPEHSDVAEMPMSAVRSASDDASSNLQPLPIRPKTEVAPTMPRTQAGHGYDGCIVQDSASAHFGDTSIRHQTNIHQQTINCLAHNPTPHDQPHGSSQRVSFLEALRFDYMESRVASVRPAIANTCSWLFDREEYIQWREAQGSNGFLWIKGKPGAGKSTLMKVALQHAKKSNAGETVISFFFNARGHDLEKAVEGMYRSLLYQLLQRLPRLQEDLPTHGPPGTKQQGWQLDMLKNYFGQAVESLTSTEQVACYIDALDECSDDDIRDAISHFDDLAELTSSFRILFSSRHYPRITMPRFVEINLDLQDEHMKDISMYLQKKLTLTDVTSKEEIASQIQTRSSGVFFWVVLVVRMINAENDRGTTQQQLRESLDSIPKDIKTLLSRILELETPSKALVATVQWVLLAREPMNTAELYFAIRLSIGDLPSPEQWFTQIAPGTMRNLILNSSRGLVEFTKGERPTAQFMHESVREYFLTTGLERLCPEAESNAPGLSHHHLAQRCLLYIRHGWEVDHFKCVESATEEWWHHFHEQRILNWCALAFFVRNHVFYHMELAIMDGVGDIDQLQHFPLTPYITLNNSVRGDAQAIDSYTPRNHPVKNHPASLLYLLTIQGAERLVTWMLETNAKLPIVSTLNIDPGDRKVLANLNIVCKTSTYTLQSILMTAIYAGSERIVRALLENGVNPNPKDRKDEIPLKFAIMENSVNIVQLLMAHGARTDYADCDGTALNDAAELGNAGIVRLLLQSGSDVNAEDNGETPLWSALRSAFVQLDVAQLLLSEGADPNMNHGFGTPLTVAVEGYSNRRGYGSESFKIIIKMLLDHGANPNRRSQKGETAAEMAQRLGLDKIVQMFSEATSKK